jgi:hypothetical protein
MLKNYLPNFPEPDLGRQSEYFVIQPQIGSSATRAKRAARFTVAVALLRTRQPEPAAARALERYV